MRHEDMRAVSATEAYHAYDRCVGKCMDLSVAASGGLFQVMTEGNVNKVLIVALCLSLATPLLLKMRNRKNARREENNA